MQTSAAKIVLITTRFSNVTAAENRAFIEAEQAAGAKIECIYSSPAPIIQTVSLRAIMFVLEMNNDTNKIIGVGMLRNCPAYEKHSIYCSNAKYNVFSYKGTARISRENMNAHEEKIMRVLDILCFSGKRHQKRLSGLKVFPAYFLTRCCKEVDICSEIPQMFKSRM